MRAGLAQSILNNMELIESLCELESLDPNHPHGIMDSFTHHHHDQQHPHAPEDLNFNADHVLFDPAMAVDVGETGEKEKALGGRKRKRQRSNGDKDVGKPKEVIHVRAKRGQATDSHSLAERVRREKINERLRCLQNLVPGCYKIMGMAVMLDVVISYVQSLQNQIEFLSMKLSAASVYYDFNSPSHADHIDTMQGTNAYEVQESMVRSEQGYGEGLPFNPSTPWPL